jgi:hypothetical protein
MNTALIGRIIEEGIAVVKAAGDLVADDGIAPYLEIVGQVVEVVEEADEHGLSSDEVLDVVAQMIDAAIPFRVLVPGELGDALEAGDEEAIRRVLQWVRDLATRDPERMRAIADSLDEQSVALADIVPKQSARLHRRAIRRRARAIRVEARQAARDL